MLNPEPGYDVFLSYQWRDRATVEALAVLLRDRGLKPFLDRWYLVPGKPWPDVLESVLRSCRAVAVVVGGEGLGSWQQRETAVALTRQAAEPNFPVIPVLLSGIEPALGFLGLNTWVDLRHGVRNDREIDALAAAIEGRPVGVAANQHNPQRQLCPYRGLRAFREEDAEFFCGRETYIAQLMAAVNSEDFVAVVGASGTGKSSVVSAGLFPALRRQSMGTVWELQTVVPGEAPLRALAGALVPILEPDLSRVDRRIEVNKLSRYLESGDVSLVDIVSDVLLAQPGTDRLLLFVDQWEEIYTLCHNEAQRTAFVNAVLDASEKAPVSIILSLRADFFVHALKDRRLADALQNRIVNLGPMNSDELRQSITLPAEKLNLRFESGLVDRMMKDVGDEPGNLPLLEFVLSAMWERRHAGMMHHDAYDEIGGVEGAIANRAQEIIDSLPSDAQEAARRILIQMVHPGEGTEDTRRRIVIPSDTTVTSILRELVDARLVVTSLDDVEGKEIAEVAHEALIQNWRTLRGWIDADREFLRTLARIEASAAQWEREDKEPSRLLAAGRALAEGEELLECRRAELNPKLLEFITASRNAARAKDRRKFRTAGFIIAVMGALGVTAGVFAYLSTQAKLDAEESLGIAREQLMRSERQAARVAAVQRILLDGAEKGLEEWKKNLKDVRSELLIQLAENFQHMGGILGYYESAYEDWDKLLSELGMTQSVAATTEYVAKILVTEVDRIDDYFAGFLESAREKLNDQDFAVYQKSLSGLRQKLFELVERRLNSACDKRASEFGRESAEMVECAILWIEVLSSLDTSEAKERAEDLVVISRRLTEEPLLLADSLELLGLALDRVGGEDAARRAALEEAFLIRRSRRLNLNATVR